MTKDEGELFPPSPRVFYRRAPLVQVIGQVHFPQILRIGREPPSEFQECVRHMFPLLEHRADFNLPTPNVAPTFASPKPGQAFTMPGILNAYQFHTEDKNATIELTSRSVSFSVRQYSQWEPFREQLEFAISALIQVYKPSFFNRVGLRYQDLIERGKLGLGGVPWSCLFRKEVVGELSVPGFEENILTALRVLNLRMPLDAGNIVIQHGLATAIGGSEVGYTIDLDFSLGRKIEVTNARQILDRLHERVGRAFRWFITDELHNALEPSFFEDDDSIPSRDDVAAANG